MQVVAHERTHSYLQAMEEFALKYPALMEPMLHERDRFIAYVMRILADKLRPDQCVVAVLGAGANMLQHHPVPEIMLQHHFGTINCAATQPGTTGVPRVSSRIRINSAAHLPCVVDIWRGKYRCQQQHGECCRSASLPGSIFCRHVAFVGVVSRCLFAAVSIAEAGVA